MLNSDHMRKYIIRPVLKHMSMYSQAAENLVIGTASHESLIYHLKQGGNGPALGIYQIEPNTYQDLKHNYLIHRHHIYAKLAELDMMADHYDNGIDNLIGNLYYATAVCRLIYYRRPEPLPKANDIEALANYWKDHYNTYLGKGRVEDWVRHYEEVA